MTEHYTSIVHDVALFVRNAEADLYAPSPYTRITSSNISRRNTRELPCGLIVGAPNVTNQSSLTDAITREIRASEDTVIVSLLSTQLPNLKAALKYINQQAASQFGGNANTNGAGRGQYLSYDLQMLRDCIQSQKVRKVVLYFRDSEGFEEALLSDLVDTFRY